jgi:hypothetical protein
LRGRRARNFAFASGSDLSLQRQQAQYALIGGAVLLLHAGAIGWLWVSKMRALAAPEIAQSLEIFWISVPPTPAPTSEAKQTQPQRASSPFRRSMPAAPIPEQSPAPPENNAITPPIDWQAELAHEAETISAKAEPRLKDFGFPRRGAPAGKAPEFAWDRVHTHRVESVGGALLVHVNDHCMIVLTPLPFPICTPGKRPANGDLFEHMKDSPAGESAAQ